MSASDNLAALSVATWKLPTHSIAEIERFAVDQTKKPDALARLRDELRVDGLFYLATCQRVLIAVFGADGVADFGKAVSAACGRALTGEAQAQAPPPTVYAGEDALRHLATVATSLDSFVRGEPQVLGQFKDAFGSCLEQSLLSSDLDWLLRQVIRLAKRVRTETEFFNGKVSTIPLTLNVLHDALDSSPGKSAAVVGSGKIGFKMAELIERKFPGTDLHLVSRSENRAAEWAEGHQGTPWQLDSFLEAPPPLDIVLLAGDAQKPFFTIEVAVKALAVSQRTGRSRLTIIDLGLPRNCSPDVADIAGCRLVQMQDLAGEAERGKAKRSDEEKEARVILEEELRRIAQFYRLRDLDRLVGGLQQDIVNAGRERLSRLPPTLTTSLAADPAFMKWYEQSLKAVAHVSMEKARRIVEEVGGYDRD